MTASTGGQGLVVSTLTPGTIHADGTVDRNSLQVLLNDLREGLITVWASGTTANRPTNPILSQLYYDTTLVEYLYCSAIRHGATAAVWTPFGSGAGGPAFGVVAVPGQSNVVATTVSDTLNVDAGSNITITTNPGTKTVTINATGGGSGTVTSVAQTVPVEFTITGSPVTTSGTLAIGKAVENANYVWAGPTSGAPAQPTFRPLAAADVAGLTGGFLQSVRLTGSGNWTVPANVSAVWVTMLAGGGGGASSTVAGTGGCGGGSGEIVENELVNVTAGGTVAYVVGPGGAADTDGSDSTFGPLACRAGKKGTTTTSGAGGGGRGAVGVTGGVVGNFGSPETADYFGGSSGGGGGATTTSNGGAGGGSGGSLTGGAGGLAGGAQAGGGGGAATIYGPGGAGGAGGVAGSSAPGTNYGSGGGGGGGKTGGTAGGAGANGDILVAWVG